MDTEPKLEPADDYAPLEVSNGVIFYMRNKDTGEIIEFLIPHEALLEIDAREHKDAR